MFSIALPRSTRITCCHLCNLVFLDHCSHQLHHCPHVLFCSPTLTATLGALTANDDPHIKAACEALLSGAVSFNMCSSLTPQPRPTSAASAASRATPSHSNSFYSPGCFSTEKAAQQFLLASALAGNAPHLNDLPHLNFDTEPMHAAAQGSLPPSSSPNLKPRFGGQPISSGEFSLSGSAVLHAPHACADAVGVHTSNNSSHTATLIQGQPALRNIGGRNGSGIAAQALGIARVEG